MTKFLAYKMPKTFFLVVFASIIIVVIYAVYTASIGGDALNGKIENGRFDVRQGAPYKEVSFSEFIVSAFLCLALSVALFLMSISVLRALEIAEIFKSKPGLKTCLNLFFGCIFGTLALYSIIVIWRALSLP